MPSFLTTKTRTLTVIKKVSGDEVFHLGPTSPVDQGYAGSGRLTWFPKFGDPSFSIFAQVSIGTGGIPGTGMPPPIIGWQMGASATVQISGMSPVTGNSNGPSYAPWPPGPVDLSWPMDATITMAVDVEEVCDIYSVVSVDPSAVLNIDGRNFPDYSSEYPGLCNSGQPDGLESTGRKMYEQVVAGSTITVTASCNGASATQSYVVPAAFPVDYLVEDVTTGSAVSAYPETFAASGSTTSTTTFNGILVGGSETYSLMDPPTAGYAYASDEGGVTVAAATTCPSTRVGSSASATVDQARTPPMSYMVDLATYNWKDPSSAYTVDYQVAPSTAQQVTGQSQAFRIVQQRQGGTISLSTDGPSATYSVPTKAEWAPVRAWIDLTSLVLAGDDARDWRIQWRGTSWKSMKLSHAASQAVWAGGAVTSATGAFAPTQTEWEGYATLQFTADQACTLKITTPQGLTKSWHWTVTTPGTPQTITLDLCSPAAWNQNGSILLAEDGRDSRWPLDSTGSYPDEITPADLLKGLYWGVFKVATIEFDGLTMGETLNVGAMSLIRTAKARSTMMPTFVSYPLRETGQIRQIQPFGILTADNKVCADWPALWHDPMSAWGDYSLSDLATSISSIPGWSAVEEASFPSDGYHNNGLPASLLFGSGAAYLSGGWQYGIDTDITPGNVEIYAQDLFDEVQGYPGIGDPDAAGYPSPGSNTDMPLRARKFLRPQAWGLALKNSDGSRLSGAHIKAFIHGHPTQVVGTASSGTDGYFLTAAPYGIGNDSTDTQIVQPTSPPTVTATWANRHRQRSVLRGTPPGGANPDICTPLNGSLNIAYVNSSNDLAFYYNSVFTTTWLVNNPAITTDGSSSTGTWSWPRICVDSNGQLEMRATLANLDGMGHPQIGVYRLYSTDRGNTWLPESGGVLMPEVVLMAATQGMVRSDESNGPMLEMVFVPDSGTTGPGTFSARWKPNPNASWSAPFVPQDDSGSNLRSDGNGFGFDHASESGNRWWLVMVKDDDSSVSMWWSADGGKTWKNQP